MYAEGVLYINDENGHLLKYSSLPYVWWLFSTTVFDMSKSDLY